MKKFAQAAKENLVTPGEKKRGISLVGRHSWTRAMGKRFLFYQKPFCSQALLKKGEGFSRSLGKILLEMGPG